MLRAERPDEEVVDLLFGGEQAAVREALRHPGSDFTLPHASKPARHAASSALRDQASALFEI